MSSSCRGQSELRQFLRIRSRLPLRLPAPPLLFQFPALLETNVSTIEALPSIELFGDKSLLLLPSCLVDDIMPNDHLKQQSFWPPTSCGANRAGFLGVESCDIKIPAYSSSCLVGNGYSNSNGMLGECSILNVF